MDQTSRPDRGGIPDLTFSEVLVLDPAAGFSGIEVDDVPIETLALFTRLIDSLPKRLDAGEPIESISKIITGAFERVERQYPGREAWDRHRLTLAAYLVARNHVHESVNLVVQVGDGALIGRTIARVCDHLAGYDSPSPYPEPSEFYRAALLAMDDNRAEDTTTFLRSFRGHLIQNNVELLDNQEFDIEHQLTERVPDYNAARDWAESERNAHPQARWDELASLVADEQLWPAIPLHRREHVAHVIGAQQANFALKRSITRKGWQALQDAFDVWCDTSPDAPIWDYLRSTLAASLFEHDHMRRGLVMTDMITRPIVQSQLVGILLQEQRHNEARRVLLAIPDTDILISTLLSSLWPRSEAKTLLVELLDIPHKPGTISKHPLELRASCMESMAAIHVERGQLDEANNLRRQIGVLRTMFAKGNVRYVRPRR